MHPSVGPTEHAEAVLLHAVPAAPEAEPESGLELDPGYYPAMGWPTGTVRAWDGSVWRAPVTVPGFYPAPDGSPVWWNGRLWVPGITPPETPGSAESAAPAEPDGAAALTESATPARRRPGAPAHRRRRPSVWHAAGTTMLAAAAVLAGLAVMVAVRVG